MSPKQGEVIYQLGCSHSPAPKAHHDRDRGYKETQEWLSQSSEATKYKELCFDAHIRRYTNGGKGGWDTSIAPALSATHLAEQHKAKEIVVSGTEVPDI